MNKTKVIWGRSRSQPKPSVLLAAKRHKKPLFSVLLVFVSSVLLFGFFFGPWLQVSDVEIISEDIFSSEEYMRLLAYGSAVTKIGPLHTANVFLVREEKVEEDLKKSFPEIKSAVVKTRLSGALVVAIEKRKERALYCARERGCYFVDEEGVAWREAPEISGLLQLIVYGELNPPELGARPVAREVLDSIFRAESRIKREGKFAVKRVELQLPDVGVATSAGFTILMDPAESVTQQLDALFLVLEKEIPEEEWEEVEYIDVRIPNRVYYKLKTENYSM